MKELPAYIKKIQTYFTAFEKWLWSLSVLAIIASYFAFDGSSSLTLIASIIGATFLIFNSKGNPMGQLLTIVFSVMYGVISYSFAYYGEMITYLGMTTPMAVCALIAWLRHPFQGNRAQVEVNAISRRELALLLFLTTLVTFVFYFILGALGTANLIPSTISVTTSFMAVYLTFRRSPYFALAYAANDAVLIVLWGLASLTNTYYISVFVCFIVFLVNDLYCFLCWLKMREKQHVTASPRSRTIT